MKNYQILINVDGIYMKVNDKVKLLGYYQTWNIKADSPKQAVILATEKVKRDISTMDKHAKEKQKSPPEILVNEISEVTKFNPTKDNDRTGKSFYLKKRWYEFWK